MKFTWIGGATFLLEIGAFRVAGDPVFGNGFEMAPHGTVTRAVPAPAVEIGKLDAVCVTCFRPDHFERGAAQRLDPKTPLIAPPAAGGEYGFEDGRMLVHWASLEFRRGGETLTITATPAHDGNGYFFHHDGGGRETTVYWTGDCRWSDDVRRVQRDLGYANHLVLHIGAEPGDGGPVSPGGKEAMQIVYRMQPNAVVAIHHHTFSHYTEPIDPFVELIGRTIYEKRLRLLAEGESYEK